MSSNMDEADMTPKATRALVPALRFPEFRDAGEWEEKTLSEGCRVTQGGTPDTTATDLWGGSIQWLTPAEMEKGDSKYIAKTVRSITEKGLSNCSSELLPVNSVIISTRAPIGHLAINKEPMAINQGCRGLIPEISFDAHFVYYYLAKSKTQLNDLGSGNTFKEISGKTLKEFLIAFPMFAEQQKIADCLSSVDELITLEARKIDALKAHKKGLMQQLFPAEGETLPKLRFPEFRDTGEWEILPLETMCSLITKGTTPTTLGFQYVDHGINFIKIESIDPNKSIDCKKIAYITDECNKALKRSQLEANDILFSIAGALGVVTIVPSSLLPANTNQALAIIRVKPEYSLHYLMNFLNSHLIKLEISKIKAGAAQPNISLSQLGNFKILMPGLFEQQKIADCLSSLDDLITLESQKIDALKAHKKGLLQKLFPSLDEV